MRKLHERSELLKKSMSSQPLEDSRRLFREMEAILDTPSPTVDYLKNPEIANLVVNCLEWVEREWNWRIPSYVIMPNHVHLLMVSNRQAKRSLTKTLAAINRHTAIEANKILTRPGKRFWQAESFDHWCRGVDKEQAVIRYVHQNPVKAGLVKNWQDWPWVK
jgi:REP element-mobilizing transposase RayT